MKNFKFKIRYILSFSLIVAAILFSIIYTSAVGSSYTMYFEGYYNSEDTPAIETLETHVEGDAVKIEKLFYEGDRLRCDITALKPGNANIEIQNEDFLWYTRFFVTPWHSIFNIDMKDFTGSKVISYLIFLVTLGIVLILVYSFIDYYRKANFCYGMAAVTGVLIFLLILLINEITGLIYNGDFFNMISVINGNGTVMNMVLTPFILIICLYISISNIVLIKHEGFRVTNLLGVIFSALWFIGTAVNIYFLFGFSGSIEALILHTTAHLIIVYVICYMECMLISTVICAILASRHRPPYDRDYIMILGCGIMKNGRLTPLLKARSVAALDFEEEQFKKAGKHAVFVPSGGQGGDEIISESEAIKRYLIKKGIPQDRILMEDKSKNTYENLLFSKQKMDEASSGNEYKSAFATTNYHIFRGYVLAEKMNFKTQGIAAKTKWYFKINAFLREFIGLLYQEKFKHIQVLLLILLFMITVKILMYL